MNPTELMSFGLRYRYYETQADITNETPWLLVCLRAEDIEGVVHIHGHVFGQEPAYNYVVGNPRMDPNPASTLPSVPVAASPAVGYCVAIE